MKLKLIGRWLLTNSGAMKRMKKTSHSFIDRDEDTDEEDDNVDD